MTNELVKFQISLGNIIQIVITLLGLFGLFYQQGQLQQQTSDKINGLSESLHELKESLNGVVLQENSTQLALTQIKDDQKTSVMRVENVEKHLVGTDTRVEGLSNVVHSLETSLEVINTTLKNNNNNNNRK